MVARALARQHQAHPETGHIAGDPPSPPPRRACRDRALMERGLHQDALIEVAGVFGLEHRRADVALSFLVDDFISAEMTPQAYAVLGSSDVVDLIVKEPSSGRRERPFRCRWSGRPLSPARAVQNGLRRTRRRCEPLNRVRSRSVTRPPPDGLLSCPTSAPPRSATSSSRRPIRPSRTHHNAGRLKLRRSRGLLLALVFEREPRGPRSVHQYHLRSSPLTTRPTTRYPKARRRDYHLPYRSRGPTFAITTRTTTDATWRARAARPAWRCC